MNSIGIAFNSFPTEMNYTYWMFILQVISSSISTTSLPRAMETDVAFCPFNVDIITSTCTYRVNLCGLPAACCCESSGNMWYIYCVILSR